MRSAHNHTDRLPEPLFHSLPGGHAGPFEALAHRAPFPHSGGGFGSSRSGPRIELELDAGPSAAAEARAAVEVLAGKADPAILEDVRLLLSEVVTNAVRHSGSPRGSKIGLTVSLGGTALRVEVTDGGRGFDPIPRDAPRMEAGGWGLHLVDRLATRWGVERGTAARVWFEIET